MEELLLNEVYHTIVAAQDIIVDAIVLEDGLVPEPEADADDMDWSETEHTDPSPAPTLTLSPTPTPTRTLSKNLTCAVCTKKMPRGKDARLHLLLCAFYAETGQKRRPNRPQQQQRPRRLCTPADYDEKKMRKQQPAPSKSEFIVAGILAHSSANEFLVRWADRGMAASWEPMSNLIDRDASGKNVQVNALLLEYAKTHRLSCLDALLN